MLNKKLDKILPKVQKPGRRQRQMCIRDRS